MVILHMRIEVFFPKVYSIHLIELEGSDYMIPSSNRSELDLPQIELDIVRSITNRARYGFRARST